MPDTKPSNTILQYVNSCIDVNDFDTLDKELQKLNLYPLSTIDLIAWTRFTAPARQQLPHWNNFVFAVKNELDRRNEPTAVLLQGLI